MHSSESSDTSAVASRSPRPGAVTRNSTRSDNERAFHASQVVCDGTVIFCERFLDKTSRGHEQMLQAARSVAAIVNDASRAPNDAKTQVQPLNATRASLERLMRDYLDFLCQRNLRVWDKNDPEALAVRQGFRRKEQPADPGDRYGLRAASPEVAANTVVCLIHQALFLLRRQLQALEPSAKERLNAPAAAPRESAPPAAAPDRTDASDAVPNCPKCGRPMQRRTARQGPLAGRLFWGCTGYPDCKGTRPLDQPSAKPSA